MKEIKDHFSVLAHTYAKFRPRYPDNLYHFLYDNISQYECAWDCGTGNGQVAEKLSEKFTNVIATDISQQQLDNAVRKPNIEYVMARAEQTPIREHSIDLITIAQAIHWFDFQKFYQEVERVAKPRALLSFWGYSLMKITPEIEKIIARLYHDIVGAEWDDERKHIEQAYKTIPLPFQEIPSPSFEITGTWKSDQLLGYLRSWSAVRKYTDNHKSDPVTLIEKDLQSLWKSDERKAIRFSIFMRTGRIQK